VVPGGNLGNVSAFAKAFMELSHLGLVKWVPRFAVINAAGADTFYQLVEKQSLRWNGGALSRETVGKYYADLAAAGKKAATLASAIEINQPVNLAKALRALEFTHGVVRAMSDVEILDAKAQVGSGGLGCEPASAAGVAGARLLRHEGVIGADERVVCILTGHQLKDPTATVGYHTDARPAGGPARFANRPVPVANGAEAIVRAVEGYP